MLGAGIGKLSTWRTWLVVLKAAFGLKLTSNELVTFYEIAGGREPPRQRVRELWVAAGRVPGALATYFALIAGGREHLAVGEEGFVLVLSPSRDQA